MLKLIKYQLLLKCDYSHEKRDCCGITSGKKNKHEVLKSLPAHRADGVGEQRWGFGWDLGGKGVRYIMFVGQALSLRHFRLEFDWLH